MKGPSNLFSKGKEDVFHMMVHELRAPLSAIKVASELILNSPTPLSQDEQTKMLRIIEDQSKKLLEQVSSLLDLAKIQASQFTVQKTPTNLSKLIQDVTTVFLPQAEIKKISLATNLDNNLPNVMADQLRISQALNNLISNSLKFTPSGGKVTINVVQKESNYIEISVSDTGIGIEKGKQKSLFTKFYQVLDNNNGSNQQGSGLGLYITKHIIEAHGGKINLTSLPGKGTTISFTIPLENS